MGWPKFAKTKNPIQSQTKAVPGRERNPSKAIPQYHHAK